MNSSASSSEYVLSRHAVAHLLEALERLACHALGGRVGRAQFGMRILQIAQLTEQRVVFPVGDFRCGFLVVKTVVTGDLSPEFTGA
jgi:hypothetical protein